MTQKDNIESVFQNNLDGHQVVPSKHVLRKLRWNLFKQDFFSFNPRKVNIVYVGVILAGAVLSPTFFNVPENELQNTTLQSAEAVGNEPSPNQENLAVESVINELEKNELNKLHAEFIPGQLTGCAPLTVIFENTSSNAQKYHWDFGTGDNSNVVNPSYTFDKPGKYAVKLEATGKGGSKISKPRVITVYEKPIAGFEIDIANSAIGPKKILFNNISSGANSYKWSFGDNTFSDEENPLHTYKDYKRYKVQLITFNQFGCSDTLISENAFIEKDFRLIFPGQFRPNMASMNNGLYERAENEPFVFYPKNNGIYKYNLRIMAPNGIEVFTSADIKKGWNGYIRGRVAPAGLYHYEVSGTYPNGKDFNKKGQVQVILDKRFDNFYDQ